MKYVLCCPNEACELHGVAFTPGKYVMKYSKELKKMVPTIVGKPYECSNCREQMVSKVFSYFAKLFHTDNRQIWVEKEHKLFH